MAKRHPALVPVSRDHHDGLLLAVRLQQGEQALTRLWSHDTTWQARAVVEFYRQHLIPHFVVEEEKVFPLAVSDVPGASAIVEELRTQHAWFRETAERMTGREDAVTRQDLVTFGEKLEVHIRLEDRDLFPMMESALGADRLEQLEKEVQEYYPQ